MEDTLVYTPTESRNSSTSDTLTYPTPLLSTRGSGLFLSNWCSNHNGGPYPSKNLCLSFKKTSFKSSVTFSREGFFYGAGMGRGDGEEA